MRYLERPYQQRAQNFLLDNKRAGLLIDMGLGKTVCVLSTLVVLQAVEEAKRVLIVAPKRVAESTWPDEITKWNHTKSLTYSVLVGTKKRRLEALQSNTFIHIINFENLKWLMEQHGKRWPYDVVVVDEATRVKSPTALGTRLLRRICRHTAWFWWLTGSGAPNGLQDLWAPMYLLDQGKRLESSIGRFREKYCQPCGFELRQWCMRDGAEDSIYRSIEDIVLSMRSEDYLELPDLIENTIKVALPEAARAQYKQMEDEFFLELESGDAPIEAVNAGAKAMKLRQLASGFVFSDDSTWHSVHNSKLEALKEVVEGLRGEPALLAYYFRPDLERIVKAIPQARYLDTADAIRDWNQGKVPVALVCAASHGHGLNLQHGGRHLIFFSLDWNLDNHLQLRKRLYRSGQKRTVIEHYIEAENTVDQLIRKRLSTKRTVQDLLYEALRAR